MSGWGGGGGGGAQVDCIFAWNIHLHKIHWEKNPTISQKNEKDSCLKLNKGESLNQN